MADTSTTIVGNLTADPDLRFTNGGNAVVNFSVAVTARWKDGDTWVDGDTSFFRCNAWRELAYNIKDSLSKGNRVVVFGYLKQRTWEDKDSGDPRSVIELEVQDIGPSLRWATATPVRATDEEPPADDGKRTARGRAKDARGAAAANRRTRPSNRSTRNPEFQDEMPEK